MRNFQSFLFVVLTVIGTDSSVVRKNTREFLQSLEGQSDSHMGYKGVLLRDDLLPHTVDGVPANRREFFGDINHDMEDNQGLTSSRIQDARNGDLGTPQLICYTNKGPFPSHVVEISCTGSCYLSQHWSNLGNHISRGCSPQHHETSIVYKPAPTKYCNANLCNRS